jgi:putative phosphoribosyl transferase
MKDQLNIEEEGYLRLETDRVVLHGNLIVPEAAQALVVFAHGSGSSRHSTRNQYVARVLRNVGIGTLLFDLLTLEEEAEDLITGNQRFDINMLTRRLVGVTVWLQKNPETRALGLGYFGASTGAAAALAAAAQRTEIVRAVVSRGGRPDLAGPLLDRVKAPTLLIVGGNDFPVIEMNREALAKLKVEKKLVIVPGATHLFEEPGTLEKASELARDWFIKHLVPKS